MCFVTTGLLYFIDWEKELENSRFCDTHFFANILLLPVSRNSLQTPSLVHVILGNFALSNWTILVKDLIRWKRCFEIFLIDHCAIDIANKNIAGKYQNILA